jgi:hypothetical protein
MMKFKTYSIGGIGELLSFRALLKIKPILVRKIFPHTYREPTPVANSALARIKERRLAKRLAEGAPEAIQVPAQS